MKKILFLLLLMASVNAEDMTAAVYDHNTRNPINNASVILYHEDVIIDSDYTDVYGIASLSYTTIDDTYHLVTGRSGYYSDEYSAVFGENVTSIRYLTPISDTGIVRIHRIGDYSGRNMYVFYAENDRLMGKYGENDTITLLVNREYIFKMDEYGIDSIHQPEKFTQYLWAYSIPFFITVIFISLVSLVIAMILFIIRKSFKK